MAPAYHKSEDDDSTRRLAVRRRTDRCFFEVEEVVPGGYVVEGVMIDADDVVEMIRLDADGRALPACRNVPSRRGTAAGPT